MYHVTKTGQVAVCKATTKPCPLGGAHFDTKERTQQRADLENHLKYQAPKPKYTAKQVRDKYDEYHALIPKDALDEIELLADEYKDEVEFYFMASAELRSGKKVDYRGEPLTLDKVKAREKEIRNEYKQAARKLFVNFENEEMSDEYADMWISDYSSIQEISRKMSDVAKEIRWNDYVYHHEDPNPSDWG